MPITAFYACLLAWIFVALSLRVIAARRGAGVALGDGGDAALRRRIRAHGNFAEYAPLGLVLCGLAEGLGSPPWLEHLVGLSLLLGRLLHAAALSGAKERMTPRVAGMALTFAALLAASAACLFGAGRAFG